MNYFKKRVLVAVDGSDQALQAIRYVSRLLPSNRTEVVLFHVKDKISENFWEVAHNPAFRHRLAGARAWAMQGEINIREFMERARQLLVDQGFPGDAVDVRIQDKKMGIARDIVREAQRDYDAVVVGRWGVSRLKDLVWGSTANKLAGLLLHGPLCVVGHTPQTGKVLIAMDASIGTMKAVDYVGTMLAGRDEQVTLFHVLKGLDLESPRYQKFILLDKEWLPKAKRSAEYVFQEATARLEKAGLHRDQISTKIVTRVGSAAKVIVEEAKNGGYGTVVVGRRGLSRVQGFLTGRVSNAVVHLARETAAWVVY
jgi:nucleotide-binding universal stress UspA family protein